MKKISNSFYIFFIFPLLFLITACRPGHYTTEKGVDCVKTSSHHSGISCNWEAWNLKTNYGIYPEKAFDEVP